MRAIFELKNISQQWQPPFEKKIESEEHYVSPGEGFGKLEKTDKNANTKEYVFKLVEIKDDRALIEYDYELTVKGYENPSDKKIWLEQGQPVSFSYLWGSDGATKKLTLKGTGA